MAQNIAIRVRGVSKAFKLPHEKQSSIKGLFVNLFSNRRGYEKQQVLNDISFEIKEGEFFGIVGRNGSGKSTLLKLLAGIYSPDSGDIQVNGKLVPFIELGVGFNPELTGRENVFLNGALLGFNRKEMLAMYDEIVEFAELGKFMDQKLKNYSSGMQVRLAFSIAIRARSDILVLDEVLAVGDEAFQRKCNEYFDQLKANKKTVILVTHSMDAVRKYCSEAILISDGEIRTIGTPEDVANAYSLGNSTVASDRVEDVEFEHIKNIRIELLSPKIVNESTPVDIKIGYQTSVPNTKIVLNLIDINRRVPLYVSHSKIFKKTQDVTQNFQINLNAINDTNIQVAVSIRNEKNEILAFPPEHSLPNFILRRMDYPNPAEKPTYAVLLDRGTWK